MINSIQQRAEHIGTFRWLEVQLMETLAAWVPTTPEMEVKVLFGRHVWDCAQHADALGKRAFEVRAPMHYTLPPAASLQTYLHEVSSISETSTRVSLFYDSIISWMTERYRAYLQQTDALMDEPSVRVIETILFDYDRMMSERSRLAKDVLAVSRETFNTWQKRQEAITQFVQHGLDGKRAKGLAV